MAADVQQSYLFHNSGSYGSQALGVINSFSFLKISNLSIILGFLTGIHVPRAL